MRAIQQIETKENFNTIKTDALERIKEDKYKYECLAILIGLDTGLRASDLLRLKTINISQNPLTHKYECLADIKKTGVKNHKTLISTDTYNAFKRFKIETPYIFTNPQTERLYTRIWLSKRTKMRYGFSFHTLRKISATFILNGSTLVDAQRHLAHKRISSTDRYLSVTERDSLDRIAHLYR